MKAALLICDHVPNDLKSIHGDYMEMFSNLYTEVTLDPFYVVDNEFPVVDEFDVFVCSGSRYSVYDDIPWIVRLKQLTREVYTRNKKFVGVCFGHQLIAESLGGKVEKYDGGFQIGIHGFTIMKKLNWMLPPVNSYNILMLCQDQISVLPEESTILSTNAECLIGMYTVGENFLGIQGHPEFSKAYNRAVFESRVDRIGMEKIEKGIASLDLDLSTSTFKNYMNNFCFK